MMRLRTHQVRGYWKYKRIFNQRNIPEILVSRRHQGGEHFKKMYSAVAVDNRLHTWWYDGIQSKKKMPTNMSKNSKNHEHVTGENMLRKCIVSWPYITRLRTHLVSGYWRYENI